jgi:hypothetical protein
LLGACGVAALVERIAPSWRRVGLSLLLVAALAQPLLSDLQHNRLLAQTDTRILASRWAVANLPPNARIKIGDYTLQDTSWTNRTYLPPEIARRVGPLELNRDNDDPRELAAGKVQYVVLSSFSYARPNDTPAEDHASLATFYEAIDRDGVLVAQFGPGVGGRDVSFTLESVYTPFWDLEQYERPGPVVRIYGLAHLAGVARTEGRQ